MINYQHNLYLKKENFSDVEYTASLHVQNGRTIWPRQSHYICIIYIWKKRFSLMQICCACALILPPNNLRYSHQYWILERVSINSPLRNCSLPATDQECDLTFRDPSLVLRCETCTPGKRGRRHTSTQIYTHRSRTPSMSLTEITLGKMCGLKHMASSIEIKSARKNRTL